MRNQYKLRVAQALAWCSLFAWTAVAAQTLTGTDRSIGATFSAIGGADWVTVAILSAFAGLVALLHRVRRSLEAKARIAAGQVHEEGDLQPIDWRVFAAAHMTGAMFAGLMAFIIGEWMELNSYQEAIGIALAAWLGAKAVDKLADSSLSRISGFVESRGVQQ